MELDREHWYEAPVVFGPSPLPDVTTMDDVCSVSIPFVTDAAALAALLPPFLRPAERPVVTVGYTMNRGVDYLGGRGYNIARVAAAAVFEGEVDTVAAPYPLVIWENDPNPVILGRERGGYAKVYGHVPDLEEDGDSCRFSCSEYDTRLLAGEVHGLQPLAGDDLGAVRRATAETTILGWKYIPGIEPGVPDANYPTQLVTNYDYDRVWRGTGSFTFDEPTFVDAPFGSRVMEALRRLPVLELEAATVAKGTTKLPRTLVHRLR